MSLTLSYGRQKPQTYILYHEQLFVTQLILFELNVMLTVCYTLNINQTKSALTSGVDYNITTEFNSVVLNNSTCTHEIWNGLCTDHFTYFIQNVPTA